MKGVVRREEEVESLIRGLLPTDTKLEVVDGPEAAFRMLLSGNADFMITSPYAADAEQNGSKLKINCILAARLCVISNTFWLFQRCQFAAYIKTKLRKNLTNALKTKRKLKN